MENELHLLSKARNKKELFTTSLNFCYTEEAFDLIQNKKCQKAQASKHRVENESVCQMRDDVVLLVILSAWSRQG